MVIRHPGRSFAGILGDVCSTAYVTLAQVLAGGSATVIVGGIIYGPRLRSASARQRSIDS
jgi:hypothetical protein